MHAVGADAQSPPSTLFQYASWNIQGKRITQCIDTLLSSEIDIHILGLQEASIPDTDDTYDPQTSLQISSHEGYVILHAQPAGCFRRLALCLEEDSMTKWCASKTGYAHLLVQVWLTFLTAPLVVVVAHLPHSGRPFEDFEQACMDLQHDLRHYSMRRTPILLLGDMNVEIHSPDDASSRAVLLQSVLLDLDLLHFSADGAPTWKERRIDHILYNNPFIHISSTIGPDTCPWALVHVRPDIQTILGVDHALLLGETLLKSSLIAPSLRQRRRSLQHRPCRMYVHNPEPIQAFVYRHIVEVQDNPSGVYASLTDFVPKCSLPLQPKRYVDPQHIKELCRLRSLCVCPATRKDYSFQIFKLRDAARKAWRKSLVQEAANGNWASRKLLQQRRPLQTAVRPLLDKHQGDRAAVAHSVQQHFQEKFSTPDDGDALEHYLHGLPDSECLFTPEEVIRAVGALKPNKTTGISRISVSLLQHLVQAEFGLHLLCTMLNAFLTDLTMLPTCLATGWVIGHPRAKEGVCACT